MRIEEKSIFDGKDVNLIYSDSVMLYQALFDRMLEGKYDIASRSKVIAEIQKGQFDTDPREFHKALEPMYKTKYGAYLIKRNLPAIMKLKTFKVFTVGAGFALTSGRGQPPFQELTSLFNASAIPNIGASLVEAAIKKGAKYLECFGDHLAFSFYKFLFFEEYHRIPNVKLRNGKTETLYFLKVKGSPLPNRKFKEIYVQDYRLVG